MFEKSTATLSASKKAVDEFVNDKLGLSVHWGIYAIIGKGEWVMHVDKIDVKEYEKLMDVFNSVHFDADEWISLLKETGIKSFMITSKHHDGFCMFDTAITDYKITNTPFKRDPIKELADVCHKYNVKLHFYYSLLDWHHPDYQSNWKSYVKYYQGQIKELCSNYGKIGGFIFDGWWPRHPFDESQEYFIPKGIWRIGETYDLIHSLQPDALIANNHHILPLPGEDYQVFELDLPGENTAGFNTTEIGDKPLASWINLGGGWSYIKDNRRFPEVDYFLNFKKRCDERNTFLWLNAAPMPDGRLQPEQVKILKEFGEALKHEREK
ncbi:MAG TPA: alpha-L-fucosidase [bacterium]|nr:alpha-L-fucosidase [bacterium]